MSDLKLSNEMKQRLFELNKIALENADYEIYSRPIDYKKLIESDNDVLLAKASKYNQYCILWFNFINEIYDYVNDYQMYSNVKDIYNDINKLIYVPEIIGQHVSWWNNDLFNSVAWNKNFIEFINYVISIFNTDITETE